MKKILFVVILLLVASKSNAQTAHQLMWDHDGLNLSYFTVQVDGQTPVNIGKPTPVGTAYSWNITGLTGAGMHTFVVSACNALDSCASSLPLEVGPPTKATGLRIQ